MSEMISLSRSEASSHRLSGLFEPKSIALVGLTDKGYWGYLITSVLNDLGYDGKLFAVNRSGKDVLGVRGFRSCAEIGEPVDVAFLLLGQPMVHDMLGEVAAAGIRNVVVLAAGYAETGDDGAVLQLELVERARSLGLTVWGPNSLGFNNIGKRTAVSSIQLTRPLLPPSIAIITQSGASAVELNDYAHSQNLGSSFIAATGNEAMLRIADLIDYLVDHDDTKAIALFCEEIRDPDGFIRAAERARAAKKAIVVLKVGRTELAGHIARAHTASLVGEDDVFSGICERLGIVRVYSAEDLIATAGLMAANGALTAPGIAFVSPSGGACTLVADAAEAAGVKLPAFSTDTIARLREILPSYGATYNPLDITGAWLTDPELIGEVISCIAASPDVGLVVVNCLLPQVEGQGFPAGLPPLGRAVAALDKPAIIATTISRMLTAYSRQALLENRLPHVVCGIDSMLRAVARLAWWSERVRESYDPSLFGGAKVQILGAPAISEA